MLDGNTPLGGDDPLGTVADDVVTATAATTLFGITQSVTVVERGASTIAQTLFGISQSATVVEREPSTISTTLFGISQEADVVEREPATIDQTLLGISQSAMVTEKFVATVETTLFGITQSDTVVEREPTAIAQTLFGITQQADAAEVMRAEADMTLFGIAQDIRVTSSIDAVATISTTLPLFRQAAHVHAPKHLKPGLTGIDAPKMAHEPRIHAAELEFFRGKVYARGVQAMVPPPIIAHHNLTTHQLPPSRPVVNRRPLRK